MRGHTHNDNDNDNGHACHKRGREDCECEYPVPKNIENFKGFLNWHRIEKDTGLISSKDEHVKAISRISVVGVKDGPVVAVKDDDDADAAYGHFEGELSPSAYHDTERVHLDPSDKAHDYSFAVMCSNPAKRAFGNPIFVCILTNAQLNDALDTMREMIDIDDVVSIAVEGACPLFPYRHSIEARLYLEKRPKDRVYGIVGFRMKNVAKTRTIFPRPTLREGYLFAEDDLRTKSGLSKSRDNLLEVFLTMIKP